MYQTGILGFASHKTFEDTTYDEICQAFLRRSKKVMSNREAAMMKIEQDKNKKNKSGNQRMTYMKQDNWRQEIISLNEGCKTFHFSTPIFIEVIDINISLVVEFLRWWVLKSKMFGQKSIYSKETIVF